LRPLTVNKSTYLIIFILLLSSSLLGLPKPLATQIASAATASQPAGKNDALKMTITGQIAKVDQGYIIRGQMSRELFTVLNPNPAILDKLATSGETVTIEAVSVTGDNIDIQAINGKPYEETH